MTKLFWQSLLAVPAALGAAIALSGAAVAAQSAPVDVAPAQAASAEAITGVSSLQQEPVQLAQITSVSQLSDVQPSDWAYQALRSLVEQYGCIQGYPDRSFRGNSAMTRYEFAAGLNACLDVIAQLVSTGINPDDLATIRRLQDEFQAELNTLRGRVDALEADVADLQAQQFSTTTKLRGQVDFHLATPFDIYNPGTIAGVPASGSETSTTFQSRARLNFDTSFTGKDLLRIRLQASTGNTALAAFRGFNNQSGVGPVGGTGALNLIVDDFYYRFPVGNSLRLTLAANSLTPDEYLRSILPFGNGVAEAAGPQYLEVGTTGTAAGPGVAASFNLTPDLLFEAGYNVSTAGAADPTIGIFQGNTITPAGSTTGASQAYGAQLSYVPKGLLNLAATYIHSDGAGEFYRAAGSTGKALDTFGGQIALNFGGFTLGGYGAYSTFDGGNDFNWLAGLAFNNFLREGAQLGIYGGQLPQRFLSDANNPFLIEGYYNVPLNQFLTITPSIIYADAGRSAGDDSTVYGVLRTTFRF